MERGSLRRQMFDGRMNEWKQMKQQFQWKSSIWANESCIRMPARSVQGISFHIILYQIYLSVCPADDEESGDPWPSFVIFCGAVVFCKLPTSDLSPSIPSLISAWHGLACLGAWMFGDESKQAARSPVKR